MTGYWSIADIKREILISNIEINRLYSCNSMVRLNQINYFRIEKFDKKLVYGVNVTPNKYSGSKFQMKIEIFLKRIRSGKYWKVK